MAERIGIIGSGIMGAGIAQIATQNGYEVIMTDVGQQQLDAAVGRITAGLDRGVQRGLFEQSVRDEAVANLKTTLDLEEAAQAPLIIENIWEEQPAKEELLEKLDRMAPADTILASNTSTLPITELAAATKRPEKGGWDALLQPALRHAACRSHQGLSHQRRGGGGRRQGVRGHGQEAGGDGGLGGIRRQPSHCALPQRGHLPAAGGSGRQGGHRRVRPAGAEPPHGTPSS